MLKEMEVIQAVVDYLLQKNFGLKQKVTSVYQHGPDIVAITPRNHVDVTIEAKGQTTSKMTSRRGKEFTFKSKGGSSWQSVWSRLLNRSQTEASLVELFLPTERTGG